jgi:Electron transfer DM13
MTTLPPLSSVYRSLLAIPTVAVVFVFGVWVAGGVISNDFKTSMALTAAWFLFSGAACLLVAWRSRALRVAVLGTYVVVAGAVGAYLGLTTLQDRVVHERVVTAAPATAAGAPAPAAGTSAPAAVEVARGRFRSHEHATTGEAAIVRLADGRRFLTLTSFETSPGPDLRVRLTPGGSFDGGTDGAVDLGALKGNRGDQQYAIPHRVDAAGGTVVIWCRAFSAPFGSARLPRA